MISRRVSQGRQRWRAVSSRPPGTWTIVLILAHIPLALLMRSDAMLATTHAVLVLAAGVLIVLGRRPDRAVYVAAYVCGAEVLWRMTRAEVFWEYGKYALVLVLLVAIARDRRARAHWPSLFYFGLLLPSALLTVAALDWAGARQALSFNLSGPLAAATCIWYFWNRNLAPEHVRGVLLVLIAPLVGVAAVAIHSTVTAQAIDFATDSVLQTSGGFGPNQVSTMLGLGAFAAFLLLALSDLPRRFLLVLFPAIIVFASQAALTFSRAGLYMAGASCLVALAFLLRQDRTRMRAIVISAALVLVIAEVTLPELDEFTEGALVARFQDTSPTGRDELARADLRLWVENPVVGVGPGMTPDMREYRPVAAHTEYTRMLAEHGSLGAISLALLVLSVWSRRRSAVSPDGRALWASSAAWALLFLTVNGFRLAAPAFMLGLSCIAIAARPQVVRRTKPPWKPVARPAAGIRRAVAR